MQGIAAAATNHSYQDCLEVLIPLVENISKDHEPEIRSVAVQQIVGLGKAYLSICGNCFLFVMPAVGVKLSSSQHLLQPTAGV